jgi:hypothetical protein
MRSDTRLRHGFCRASTARPRRHHPVIPDALLVRPGLVVCSIDDGYWFWGRSFDELWRDLRAVSQETRPDRDPSDRRLREAWNAGDHSRLHGWNRHSSQLARKT